MGFHQRSRGIPANSQAESLFQWPQLDEASKRHREAPFGSLAYADDTSVAPSAGRYVPSGPESGASVLAGFLPILKLNRSFSGLNLMRPQNVTGRLLLVAWHMLTTQVLHLLPGYQK